MNDRFVKIGEASKILGVHTQTLRRWEEGGVITPAKRTLIGLPMRCLLRRRGFSPFSYKTPAEFLSDLT